MKEYVFKPSRFVAGKRVRSDYYYGRYTLPPNPKPFQVPLNTPDKDIARKRLRDIVLEAQREKEGFIAPRTIREASTAEIADMFADYEADLKSQGLAPNHVRDTTRRLKRMALEAKWRQIGDIRPDSFIKWRSTLFCSAKTKKEYQVSVCAFLNWLVRVERLAVNPLARIDRIDTRGKQVRESRAFTEDEIVRLFRVAKRRLPAYQALLYTSLRRDELKTIVWGDLHLDEAQPYVLIRAAHSKDKDKRAIPLHPSLAAVFREMRPEGVAPGKSVFFGRFPTYESLRYDLERAGIPHKDELGRVVHFHAFRKTWQTLGVRHGINQRAAQEILGHSDPSLTAKVYTDVAALSLHSEIAKLPWIGGQEKHSLPCAPGEGVSRHLVALHGTKAIDLSVPQIPHLRGESRSLALSDLLSQLMKMVVGSGFEPTHERDSTTCESRYKPSAASVKSPLYAPDLARVLRHWDGLPPERKEQVLAALEGVAVPA
jgi:integrase